MLSENIDPEILLKRFLNNENNSNFQNYTNEPVASLLSAAGSPHNHIRSVHIAGTNGKGSTSAYIESIFRHAGYITGLYTSPHLIKINERIKLSGNNIPDEDLVNIINDIIFLIDNNSKSGPTWFDVITAAALIYFRKNNVDIAIIETGLGGLKDSTNVITPLLTVITDISMDHQNLLGNTIELITKEKCGIIKKHTPIITSNTNRNIIKIISETAFESESTLYAYGNNFNTHEEDSSGLQQTFTYSFPEFNISLQKITLTHPAETQIKNASLALTASVLLSDKYKKINYKNTNFPIKSTELMGRFEIHGSDPELIFDPAHNIASISDLCKTIDKNYGRREKLCIISFMNDKDYSAMLVRLKKSFNNIYYCILDDPRTFIPDTDFISIYGIKKITSGDILQTIETYRGTDAVCLFTGTFRIYNLYNKMCGCKN